MQKISDYITLWIVRIVAMRDFKVLRSELATHHHLMMLNPVEFSPMREKIVTSKLYKKSNCFYI